MDYPIYRIEQEPGSPLRFICIASPTHAVDIFETTDPHNHDPLGFEFRILRSRPTVKLSEAIGGAVTKAEWFKAATQMMLTHLGSIDDLVKICDLRRDTARICGGKADYAGVINTLQEVKPSRHNMIRHRLEKTGVLLIG